MAQHVQVVDQDKVKPRRVLPLKPVEKEHRMVKSPKNVLTTTVTGTGFEVNQGTRLVDPIEKGRPLAHPRVPPVVANMASNFQGVVPLLLPQGL